jgi:transposase
MDAAPFRELQPENERLRQQLAERDRLIEQLQQTVRDLQQRLEAAERSAKRQAAPFSKGEPKKNPKKPGRKNGAQHGQHGHRPPPPPTQVDETLEAPLPTRCPDCGGTIAETHCDQQFQTEIPRQPIHRQFNIHCGRCQDCGRSVRGRHSLQTSDATGAAQSQLGPDAQAAVVDLNKRAGMSYGKIVGTFAKFFGITLSRGACAQIVLRAGRRLRPVYEQIQERIKTAEHLTPDESGWRIGGHPVWIHAWVGDDGTTCYVIDPCRGGEVLAEVIGWDWSGTMTHDGYSSYDRFDEATHQQCVDHVLRRARKMAEQQNGAARVFPLRVIDLFQEALAVRDQFLEGHIDQAALEQAHEQYVTRLLDLSERPRLHDANNTLAKHLYNHGEQWLMFLLDASIPATNHRAEQALKGPIVNRKVWGGNRTDAGAAAQEVTSSVLQTCKNKAIDAFDFVSSALRGVIGNLFLSHDTSTPAPAGR